MSTESPQPHAVAQHVIPPTMGPLRRHTHTYDLMRQCIHCGFCLPVCPTYAVLGTEMRFSARAYLPDACSCRGKTRAHQQLR